MYPEVINYLDSVRSHLHLDPVTEKRIISELYTYFQEKVAELQERGVSERDAAREAIRSFGRARVVARLMYEAYSKGSRVEALLSSLPHLIVAGLFASHLWHHQVLVPVAFIVIVGVTLFGWWHGKPNWLYSWVGYSLLPPFIIGYASLPVLKQTVSFVLWGQGSLPGFGVLLLIGILFISSLLVIIRTTIRVVRRDWILASLILVPLPILGSWLYNIEQVGGLFRSNGTASYQWDTSMASVLIVLAIASATFILLRQRVLKAGALVTLGIIALTIAGHNLWGDRGFIGFMAFSLLSLIFLLSPALLEDRIGHGEWERETWESGDWIEPSPTTR